MFMNEIIYLEADEEITSVIDRLRKVQSSGAALVIPRGGNLAQSIVNLKLLKKSAEELGKEISLVANDRISRNLASQIGLTVFSKVAEAERSFPKVEEEKIVTEESSHGKFKINSYRKKEDDQDDAEINDNAEPEPEEEGEATDEEDEIREEQTPSAVENDEPKKTHTVRDAREEEEFTVKRTPMKKIEERHAERESAREENEVRRPKKQFSKSKKILVAVSAFCLLGLFAIAYLLLPYARANVTIKAENFDIEKEITADKSAKEIDQEKLIIPATTIELEKEVTKTYKTTGKKEVGERAKGKITVNNKWDNNSLTLEKGTKFVSNSKVFLSTEAVTVPGGSTSLVKGEPVTLPGSAEVSVEAENPGDSYNLGASTFIISSLPAEKQSAIKGISLTAMSGGSSKTLNLVAEQDLKSAEDDLKKSIEETAKPELIQKADGEKQKINETKIMSELISKESSKNLNDETESFDYRMKLKITSLAYKDDDLKTIMISSANSMIKDDSMLINPEKSELQTFIVDDGSSAADSSRIKTIFKGKVGQKISSDEIRDKIKYKKFSEAGTIIEGYGKVEDVNLQIWPTNLARVPLIKSRISITFDYTE